MDNLLLLDNVCHYKFGVVQHKTKNYLTISNTLYICDNEEEPDAITVEPVVDTVRFVLDHVQLELKLGNVYSITPAPKDGYIIRDCIVKHFIHAKHAKHKNTTISFPFLKERWMDAMRQHIGDKRLAMTCWPFDNISLNSFLKKCDIPHIIVLRLFDKHVIYDQNVDIDTDCCDTTVYFKKVDDTRTNGSLFIPNDKLYLEKHVNYHFLKTILNDTGVTDGSIETRTEYEPVFIIFNHHTPVTCDTEIVLATTVEPLPLLF